MVKSATALRSVPVTAQALPPLASGFEPKNVTILATGVGRNEEVWAYENDYKGKTYFHIRTIWFSTDGAANPSKGVSIPIAMKDTLLAALKTA